MYIYRYIYIYIYDLIRGEGQFLLFGCVPHCNPGRYLVPGTPQGIQGDEKLLKAPEPPPADQDVTLKHFHACFNCLDMLYHALYIFKHVLCMLTHLYIYIYIYIHTYTSSLHLLGGAYVGRIFCRENQGKNKKNEIVHADL